MHDRDFLIWIHEWLEHTHGEKPTLDYMRKLRAVIKGTDRMQLSPNTGTENSLQEVIDGLDG